MIKSKYMKNKRLKMILANLKILFPIKIKQINQSQIWKTIHKLYKAKIIISRVHKIYHSKINKIKSKMKILEIFKILMKYNPLKNCISKVQNFNKINLNNKKK